MVADAVIHLLADEKMSRDIPGNARYVAKLIKVDGVGRLRDAR